jgi:hypothetical protein
LVDKQLFAFGNLVVKDNIMKYIKQKAE